MAKEQFKIRALKKTHTLTLSEEKKICLYQEGLDEETIFSAMTSDSFEVLNDDDMIIAAIWESSNNDDDENNGMPFNFDIRLFDNPISIVEYDELLAKFNNENDEEAENFFESGENPLCTGTLYDAIEWATQGICKSSLKELSDEEKFIAIKSYMEELVHTRWAKESLEKHLSEKFNLKVELQDTEESGLVCDYAFLWGLFDGWGYVDIYYLKIPFDLGDGKSIYITEVNVSEE